jgi:hypothetical protein
MSEGRNQASRPGDAQHRERHARTAGSRADSRRRSEDDAAHCLAPQDGGTHSDEAPK